MRGPVCETRMAQLRSTSTRASASAGHLAVQLRAARPVDAQFLFEPSHTRMAPAAAAAAAWHLAFGLLIALLVRATVPAVPARAVDAAESNARIVWIDEPGPGGGGGGGGNRMNAPSRAVELPGHDRQTVPVARAASVAM